MDPDQELERWLLDEQAATRRIAGGAGYGVPDAKLLLRLSGMDAMIAGLQSELPSSPMQEAMNYRLLEVEKGRVLFQGTPTGQHRNPAGTIHGGWISTLLDSCMTAAVYTLLDANRGYTTIELGVNFVKAITPKVRALRAEGKVVHSGRQFATAEGRLFGPGGVLFAHAKTTCYLFDIPAT